MGAVLRRIVQFNAVRCRTPMAVGRASKKVQKRAENWQKSQGGAEKGRKLAEKPRGGRKVQNGCKKCRMVAESAEWAKQKVQTGCKKVQNGCRKCRIGAELPSVGRKAQKSAQKAPWAGSKRHPPAKFGNHLAEKRRTPQQA